MNNNMKINYLNEYLSNLAVLNTKLHNFHWNIVGPLWINIHELTETYYDKIFEMYDVVGERIKQYGTFPITDTKTYAEIATIKDVESKDYRETEVISGIIQDFEYMNNVAKQIIKLAEETNDPVLAGIMTDDSTFYEKELWVLKSHLK